ncbi:MAG: hypothetical protein LAO20_17960 [Acidobacteriia bacterium]|nr:hypothetical protein [Terriglobia bacterium]
MFQGTTIDELINSVERAEQNAHKQTAHKQTAHKQSEDAVAFSFRDYPLRRVELQELTEVA